MGWDVDVDVEAGDRSAARRGGSSAVSWAELACAGGGLLVTGSIVTKVNSVRVGVGGAASSKDEDEGSPGSLGDSTVGFSGFVRASVGDSDSSRVTSRPSASGSSEAEVDFTEAG